MTEITVHAPAKINLVLTVKGRRPDGYHEIDTLMQKLELADRLRLRVIDRGIRLRCPGTDLPENGDNLVFRAARAFLDAAGLSSGIDIVLHKRIPVAAGLGGGSSDAAAVLTGLNTLFAAGLDHETLHGLGRSLGADVPFFVAGYVAARATGIGDRLVEASSLDRCSVVLVSPGFPVSTRWVYENLALTTRDNPYILARNCETTSRNVSKPANLPIELSNDLEGVTIRRFPVIAQIKQQVLQAGAEGVLMSGSGPTVFGLFCGEPEQALSRARACCRGLAGKYGGQVILTGVAA
ncbi:MAG: 4-(cytidine 5'-diphospho)-2-C-methyl-D-erythritol kinase [Desulfobacterales bacterium]|nr:4-(cytidine 5'-diphospho)-2-C-methyl-D-erythritol kinase [Desulfobacterales bacterium]